MRALSVLIVINAVVSFRSVPRIFNQLLTALPYLAFKVPCPNSVINWSLRYGHHLLSNVAKIAEDWFAIVDMSIETGLSKALVVLRVPFSTWNRQQDTALCLENCEAISVDVRQDWNADTIRESLEKVFATVGQPAFIIKDQGSDLSAGVRQLGIPDVGDIGHKGANALKRKFAKDKWFIGFLSLVAAFGAKLRQSKFAHLTPPRIRSKGRFQSISRVAEWAENLLAFFGAAERETPKGLEPLMRKLSSIKGPLSRLARACLITDQIQGILKKHGLNHASQTKVQQLLDQLSSNCPVKRILSKWISCHMGIFATIKAQHPTLKSLPVSSDVIESLFGRFKHVLARHPRPELGHLTVLIAILCGKHSTESVNAALRTTTNGELQILRGNYFPHSIEAKRRAFLREAKALANSQREKDGTVLKAG